MAEVDFVSKWQQSLLRADEEPLPAEPSLVADFYESLSPFYRDILDHLSQEPSVKPSVLLSLQRTHSYLVLWADGVEIGEGMMDASLLKSKRVRVTTLRLLLSVSRTLTDRLLPHVDCDQTSLLVSKGSDITHLAAQAKDICSEDHNHEFDNDTDSDTSSDDGDTTLSEIAEDLRTDTQCLLDLASRFQEPAIGPVAAEPAVELDGLRSWDPAQSFINRIRQRYPQCEATLAERLGNASWSRVLHCKGLKTENFKIQQQTATKTTNETSSKAASTLFHDSGLGSSVPSDPTLPAFSEYADTVVSYDGGQGGSVRVPPLPEGARDGIPFECVGCGAMVTARGKRTWKKHLFQDLQPYMCLEDSCSRNKAPFATREEWTNHLSLEHGDKLSLESVDCRVCSQKLSANMLTKTSHLARHLEEIALTVLPKSLESAEGMDDDSRHDSTESSLHNEVGETGYHAAILDYFRQAGRSASKYSLGTPPVSSGRVGQMGVFHVSKRSTESKGDAEAMPPPGQPAEPPDDQKQPPPRLVLPNIPSVMGAKAVVLYDFSPSTSSELPLSMGQAIEVWGSSSRGWFLAKCPNTEDKGWVPMGYVRLLPSQHDGKDCPEEHLAEHAETAEKLYALQDFEGNMGPWYPIFPKYDQEETGTPRDNQETSPMHRHGSIHAKYRAALPSIHKVLSLPRVRSPGEDGHFPIYPLQDLFRTIETTQDRKSMHHSNVFDENDVLTSRVQPAADGPFHCVQFGSPTHLQEHERKDHAMHSHRDEPSQNLLE